MIHAFVLAAVVYVTHEPFNPQSCPTQTVNGETYGALGYVRVIKDGYRIAGGKGYYDPHTPVLTAWFPPERSSAQVVMTLDLRPSAVSEIQTEGRGSVRIHHGVFCAYPEPRPPTEYYQGVPASPSPSPKCALQPQENRSAEAFRFNLGRYPKNQAATRPKDAAVIVPKAAD